MIQMRTGTVSEAHQLMLQLPEFKSPYSLQQMEERLKDDALILLAAIDGKQVGFKCGHRSELDPNNFYSWLGGVLPDYRRKGVALDLLKKMEGWCIGKGYRKLVFKTLNEHKGMLIFALKNGFEITEVVSSEKDARKRIVLQKILQA